MEFYVGEMVKVSAIVPHSEGGGRTGRVTGWKVESVEIDFQDGDEGWVDREFVLPIYAEDPATVEALVDAAADALCAAQSRRDDGNDEEAERLAVDAAYFAAAALSLNERSRSADEVMYAIETEFGDAI